jgi:hypothetical protein
MFTTNPFTPLTTYVSPEFMQGYIVLLMLAVLIGTGFDLLHDGKARFFLQDRQRARAAAKRPIGSMELAAIATKTLVNDIATFGEFCNRSRRISHVLMFYGFVLYLVTTVVMVFGYPSEPHPPMLLPLLWNVGVLLALVGGYWFFFLLRVNVVHDGQPPWRLVRADLFIITLLGSLTFALLFRMGGDGGGRDGNESICRPLPPVHDTALRVRTLVQVRPHVLQAGRGLPEKAGGGGRFVQPANADSTKR